MIKWLNQMIRLYKVIYLGPKQLTSVSQWIIHSTNLFLFKHTATFRKWTASNNWSTQQLILFLALFGNIIVDAAKQDTIADKIMSKISYSLLISLVLIHVCSSSLLSQLLQCLIQFLLMAGCNYKREKMPLLYMLLF